MASRGWHTLPAVQDAPTVTEVHPGIGRFADVKRIVDFLGCLPSLSDADRHAILMGALDSGVVSIPIDKISVPQSERPMTRREVEGVVMGTLSEAWMEIRTRGLR